MRLWHFKFFSDVVLCVPFFFSVKKKQGYSTDSFFGGKFEDIDMTLQTIVDIRPCSFERLSWLDRAAGSLGSWKNNLVRGSTCKLSHPIEPKGFFFFFCKNKLPLIISTTKVKCVCSYKDGVAVKRHTVG